MEHNTDSFTYPIIVVVLEGKSDITYLRLPLEAYYQDKYSSKCKLIAVRDVTSDPSISDDNFIFDFQKRIECALSDAEHKMDHNVALMIKEVVHIFDIDSAYVSEDKIYLDKDKTQFFYSRDGISFNNPNLVIKRNKTKQYRISSLLNLNTIHIFDRDIDYKPYYFCINIDDFHVEEGLNLTQEEKNKHAAFYVRENYIGKSNKGKVRAFLKLFNKVNPEDIPLSFSETWTYIQVNNNSLKKCSNVFLIPKGLDFK